MGTTGAAMLLIRPVISTNQERRHTTHTILFFIGAVANCGGLLTPLGDPPLFMLYLRGVEFTWFLHLLPEWGLTGILLLSIYYFTDRHYYNKEEWVDIAEDMIHIEPIKITGKINFIYLALVVATVAFVNKSLIPAMGNEESNFAVKYLRELILIGISIIAYISTPKSTFEKNKFSWAPIAEVAFLFLGIFITMSPSLIYLANHATELGITKPTHFLYASGTLSSFLDNTPTAVVLAGGSKLARDLPVYGRQLNGIYPAMDYLTQQNRRVAGVEVNEPISAKDKAVVVIGGGDTGADCVGTAVRQGAKSVYQIELLTKPNLDRPQDNPWPNYPQILRISTSHEEASVCLGGTCKTEIDVREWQVNTKEFVGDENGNLKQTNYYVNGKTNGIEKRYYENG
jgi:hypothetical protein